jgi:hypothetical protein
MNILNACRAAGQNPDGGRGPWYPADEPGSRPGPGSSLRKRRQAPGWNVPEMARQLREAAKASGDESVPGNKAASGPAQAAALPEVLDVGDVVARDE